MIKTIHEYYSVLTEQFPFDMVYECSQMGDHLYRMQPEYGTGSLRLISFNAMFIVLIADYTPLDDFEKVSMITQSYVEISQFETNSSSFKVGKQKIKPVKKGICCYINNSKKIHVYCEKGKPVRFTKVILSKEYYDDFLHKRYGDSYQEAKNAVRFLSLSPNQPELNFIFQQIKSSRAKGSSMNIYLEGKILELLALATYNYEQAIKTQPIHVKLSNSDMRSLKKVIKYMNENLSKYPSIEYLSKMASMSTSRFQLAFKKSYGTTVYEYLKSLRMNQALLLLQDSDYSIQRIAKEVGYNNAGHFAGIFKKIYGVTPKIYRTMQDIL